MNSNCTPIVREAVWNLQNTLRNEAAEARLEAQRAADIAHHFHFSKNDDKTLLTATGFPVQLAMDLTEKVSGRVRTVICKVVDGEWVWFVENMSKCPVEASDLIRCVKQRVGAKLAGQLTGKVVLQ